MKTMLLAIAQALSAPAATAGTLGPFEFNRLPGLGWALLDLSQTHVVGHQCSYPGACWDITRGTVYYRLETEDPVLAERLDDLAQGQHVRVTYDEKELVGTWYEDPLYRVHVTGVKP
jgi:hypothetical protein